MMRRSLLILILALVALGGCAKQQWQGSRRLDTLREQEDYRLTHVVAPGETLRSVAELYYDDPALARRIAAENALVDADDLPVGTSLRLSFDEDEWRRAEIRREAMAPYNRGVEALGLGRLQVAGEEFHHALTLDPDFRDAQYNLALVWLRRGRYEDAEAMLLPLRERAPDDTDVGLAYGQALFHQARFDEAVTALDRVLAVEPGRVEAEFSRASALGAGGRYAAARAAWREFLVKHPRGFWAERAEARRSEMEAEAAASRSP